MCSMLKVFAVIELVLLIVYPGAHGLSRDDFPPGFVFGASTSAYQVHLSLSQFLNFSMSTIIYVLVISSFSLV